MDFGELSADAIEFSIPIQPQIVNSTETRVLEATSTSVKNVSRVLMFL